MFHIFVASFPSNLFSRFRWCPKWAKLLNKTKLWQPRLYLLETYHLAYICTFLRWQHWTFYYYFTFHGGKNINDQSETSIPLKLHGRWTLWAGPGSEPETFMCNVQVFCQLIYPNINQILPSQVYIWQYLLYLPMQIK